MHLSLYRSLADLTFLVYLKLVARLAVKQMRSILQSSRSLKSWAKVDVFSTSRKEPGPGRETRFTRTEPANEIIRCIEQAAKPLGFNVQKWEYRIKLEGDKHGRKGHLSQATEVIDKVQEETVKRSDRKPSIGGRGRGRGRGEEAREVVGVEAEAVMEGGEEEVIKRILLGAEVVVVEVVEADLAVDEAGDEASKGR